MSKTGLSRSPASAVSGALDRASLTVILMR
jgi:hypothetical protein